jgi:hypothetical protein
MGRKRLSAGTGGSGARNKPAPIQRQSKSTLREQRGSAAEVSIGSRGQRYRKRRVLSVGNGFARPVFLGAADANSTAC